MRRATSNFSVIKDENIFYGISLGYDYCAEHEWGIEKMRKDLGIGTNPDVLGLENRIVTKNNSVIFKKDEKQALLTNHLPWRKTVEEVTLKDLTPNDLSYVSQFSKDLATAWDGEHFCIIVSGEENINHLENLYNQFKNNNVAITRINSEIPAFSNASLCVLIADRLPQKSIDGMYAVDKAAKDLVDYEAEIGLTKLKEETRNGYKKEKYYCACSPRWINYENPEAREKTKEKLGTKYDIQYWINYSDDDDNYGYYTVEEIKKWLSTPGLKLTHIRKA